MSEDWKGLPGSVAYALGGSKAVRAIRKRYPGLRRGEWRRIDVQDDMVMRWPYKGEVFMCGYIDPDFSVMMAARPSEWGDVTHLQVRRHDLHTRVLWTDLQRIKNEICGNDATAVQVFPSEVDLVDEVNAYHLWVLPRGFSLPFGLKGRTDI